jgi:hypothetical protein
LLATETPGFLDDACSLLSLIDEIDLGLIQLTAIANDVKLANRILGTVTASATTGDCILKWTGVTLYNSTRDGMCVSIKGTQ